MNHLIILAGGKGTRMNSDKPKVLTPIKGLPIIKHLLNNTRNICAKPTIIVGYKADEVKKALGENYHYVYQPEQKGTGHAVMCAKDDLIGQTNISSIIVLLGDHPLVNSETIKSLVNSRLKNNATISLATLIVPNYNGDWNIFNHYGRVIKDDDGKVLEIVEYKDASDEIRSLPDVNISYYCFDPDWLWNNINLLTNNNAAKEYYLTDIVKLAKDQGKKIVAHTITNRAEAMGINTPEQLKMLEPLI